MCSFFYNFSASNVLIGVPLEIGKHIIIFTDVNEDFIKDDFIGFKEIDC